MRFFLGAFFCFLFSNTFGQTQFWSDTFEDAGAPGYARTVEMTEDGAALFWTTSKTNLYSKPLTSKVFIPYKHASENYNYRNWSSKSLQAFLSRCTLVWLSWYPDFKTIKIQYHVVWIIPKRTRIFCYDQQFHFRFAFRHSYYAHVSETEKQADWWTEATGLVLPYYIKTCMHREIKPSFW